MKQLHRADLRFLKFCFTERSTSFTDISYTDPDNKKVSS